VIGGSIRRSSRVCTIDYLGYFGSTIFGNSRPACDAGDGFENEIEKDGNI
jgi:hypothetical protein